MNPFWTAALLPPSTSVITYLGRARIPLTISRFYIIEKGSVKDEADKGKANTAALRGKIEMR